jgi:O-methyltransferase
VSAYLGPNNRISFHQGLFPRGTSKQAEGCKFSFVYLDIELYRATLESLEFFHPRLSRAPVLIVHDYLLSGVHKAVAEFSECHSETFVPLNGSQVLFVKG